MMKRRMRKKVGVQALACDRAPCTACGEGEAPSQPRVTIRRFQLQRLGRSLALSPAAAIFLSLFLLVVSKSSSADTAKPSPPNVLLFFIDDLGYGDLGCYGSTFYETPRIDKLADASVRFTNFYSASPVCSPTRAALMTGQAPQRVGITQWLPQPHENHLPLDQFTLGEAFSQAGYRTGYIGKWHLGHSADHAPDKQGFAWTRCVNQAGQPATYFHPFAGRKKEGVGYWDVPDLDEASPGDYLTDKLTDNAIEFLGTTEDKRPFLLCLAHYAVHTPIQSPKPLVEKYQEKRAKEFGEGGDQETQFAKEGTAQTRLRQDDPGYAAMVENLDTNVGRVLDYLEQSGQRDNTIVIFTSDNGGLSTLPGKRQGPTCVRPLRAGKGWTYEGGIRVPLLISVPDSISASMSANADKTCDTPGITMDLYPTLLDLCGLPANPKQHLDGITLAPAMKNVDLLTRRTIAWHYPHKHGSGHTPSSAIRYGRWKLVRHAAWKDRAETVELYDLASDPGETKNLAESNADTTATLTLRLDEWLQSTDASKESRVSGS